MLATTFATISIILLGKLYTNMLGQMKSKKEDVTSDDSKPSSNLDKTALTNFGVLDTQSNAELRFSNEVIDDSLEGNALNYSKYSKHLDTYLLMRDPSYMAKEKKNV